MYKICKSEQSASRQRELELGLVEVMLTRNYDNISVSDLCDHMQIPRKSFYRYFSNKDGAFLALLDHTLERCNNYIDPCTGPTDGFQAYFEFWLEQKPLLDALDKSELSSKLVAQTYEFAMKDRGFVRRLMSRFPGAEEHIVVMFLSTGLISTVLHWHKTGFKQSPSQLASTIDRVFSSPLLPF